jgi:hypothetical protein
MFLLQHTKPRCLVYRFVICIYQKKGKYREGLFCFFGKYASYKDCVYWAGISCSALVVIILSIFFVKSQLKDLLKTHPCWIREQWESPFNMSSPSLPTVLSMAIQGKGIVPFFLSWCTLFVLFLLLACLILLSNVATVSFLLWARCCLLFLPPPPEQSLFVLSKFGYAIFET